VEEEAVVDVTLLDDARDLLSDTVSLRRQIHAHPEVGLELPHTQELVLAELEGLGLDITAGQQTTSVVAVLEGGCPGPATLLRGDMDALPLREDTGLECSSKIDGAMHACGHDAHVAMLVGAARLLASRRRELPGRVLFMFQPGEEGHAGASVMLGEGLLDRHGPVDRAFAIHTSPNFPAGTVATRAGTLLASADAFTMTISGRGGHASMPHDAIDPIPVACELVIAIQAMVTRRVSAFDPAVVTVGSIRAGTAGNVIPETVELYGTVRAVSEKARQIAMEGVVRVAEHVCTAHLCHVAVNWPGNNYPVTVNGEAPSEQALAVAVGLLGEQRVQRMPTPFMGAEDWSFVLQQVPGCMAFLGTGPEGVAHPAPNHSNRMLLQEDAMATGIALHAAIALAPADGEAADTTQPTR
jgi:amidohydrolase